MRKKSKLGFSFLEMIFIIILIGILTAVALASFVDEGNKTHVSNLKNFQETLNRTLSPVIFLKENNKKNKTLKNLSGKEAMLSYYIEIPIEFTSNGHNDANLSDQEIKVNSGSETDIFGSTVNCSQTLYKLKDGDKEFQAKVGNDTYHIDVCDGSSTTAPKFYIVKD